MINKPALNSIKNHRVVYTVFPFAKSTIKTAQLTAGRLINVHTASAIISPFHVVFSEKLYPTPEATGIPP